MKYLLVLVILISGYYAYNAYHSSTNPHPTMGEYHPDKIEKKPIPREIVLDGHVEYARALCSSEGFLNSVSSTRNKCVDHLKEWREPCKTRILKGMSSFIHNKSDFKKYGKKYLSCVLPE